MRETEVRLALRAMEVLSKEEQDEVSMRWLESGQSWGSDGNRASLLHTQNRELQAEVVELRAQLAEAYRWMESVQPVAAAGWTQALTVRCHGRAVKKLYDQIVSLNQELAAELEALLDERAG